MFVKSGSENVPFDLRNYPLFLLFVLRLGRISVPDTLRSPRVHAAWIGKFLGAVIAALVVFSFILAFTALRGTDPNGPTSLIGKSGEMKSPGGDGPG